LEDEDEIKLIDKILKTSILKKKLISEEEMKNIKKKNQYDEFLHKIQQQKMKELWDNKEDEAWENA